MHPTMPPADTAPIWPSLADPRPAHHPPAFVHPEPPTSPRIAQVLTHHSTHELLITLPPGANFATALHRTLDGFTQRSGCARISGGGVCAHVEYHVIIRAAHAGPPYVYGPPIVCDGDVTLVDATITIGRCEDGSRVLHCHGGMIDARGRHHGGHLDLQRTVVGHEPMRVRVCLFDEVELVVSHDPETTYDLLQPIRTPLV